MVAIGLAVCFTVGVGVGNRVVGVIVGFTVGTCVGDLVVGAFVGLVVGEMVGTGALVGFTVEGRADVPVVGLEVVGLPVGLEVGRRVVGEGVEIVGSGVTTATVKVGAVVGAVGRSQCVHPL